MNERLSRRLCFLVHICSASTLRCALLQFSLLPVQPELLVDSAPALPTVMVFAVAHPLMSKFSNKCFCLGSLLCVVLSCFRSIRLVRPPSLPPHLWLCCQHWLAFALTDHAHLGTLSLPASLPRPSHPPLSPLKIMPGCCDDDFLLCCAALPLPACPARGTSPRPCPVPIGDCRPSRAPSVTDCALGNGVVHQNLGLLLTGTTSARNVSTRSRGRRFPWATTPPSHKREFLSCSVAVFQGLHILFSASHRSVGAVVTLTDY